MYYKQYVNYYTINIITLPFVLAVAIAAKCCSREIQRDDTRFFINHKRIKRVLAPHTCQCR